MKRLFSIFIILLFFFCSEKTDTLSDYWNITILISTQEFENLKSFTINCRDREIYCNLYLDNPHYSSDGFEVYLNPATGQANINCDADLSD